jgi:transposase-like protein
MCEVMVVDVAIVKVEGQKRLRRSIAEKRRIVELAALPGASIARIAREHGVNANMVHYWRSCIVRGAWGRTTPTGCACCRSRSAKRFQARCCHRLCRRRRLLRLRLAGAIYIEFPKIHLRVESGADAALLRVVLETLQR